MVHGQTVGVMYEKALLQILQISRNEFDRH